MTAYDSATQAPPATGRAANIGLWVLQALLAAMFVLGGVNKLIGEAHTVAVFQQIGWGDWFMVAIGIVELAGAIGLLIPRLSGLAALGIVALMIGAVVITFAYQGGAMVYMPVIFGVLAGIVAWGRRGSITQLLALVRR